MHKEIDREKDRWREKKDMDIYGWLRLEVN